MNKEIHNLAGVSVESKEEKQSTKGKTYYSLKAGGHQMSCWDSEMAEEIPVGATVDIQYSVNKVGDKSYNNVVSICESNHSAVKQTKTVEEENKTIEEVKVETVKQLQTNNSEDLLFNACVAEALNIVGRVYDTHYVKEADVPIRFDENWVKGFGETLESVYDKAKEVRKEKLGY